MNNRILLVLALFTFVSFSSELDSLWDSAIQSGSVEQTSAWNIWLEAAKQQNVRAASPHINLAASLWEEKKVPEAIEQVLLSAQNRSLPWSAWSDLSLANEIQHALVSQPSPLDSIGFRLSLIWNQDLLILWASLIFWISFVIVYRKFGPKNKKGYQSPLLVTVLALFLVGLAFEVNKQLANEPMLLKDASGMIPVFKEAKADENQKIMELPAGLLVFAQSTQNELFKVEQPIPGWIESKRAVNFPKPQF